MTGDISRIESSVCRAALARCAGYYSGPWSCQGPPPIDVAYKKANLCRDQHERAACSSTVAPMDVALAERARELAFSRTSERIQAAAIGPRASACSPGAMEPIVPQTSEGEPSPKAVDRPKATAVNFGETPERIITAYRTIVRARSGGIIDVFV